MAVRIRLKRLGKIRQPYYRIVVSDARKKRDGRVIEDIGLYHPKNDPSVIEVNSERARYWLGVGAQPSEPVLAILKLTGDWQAHKGLPAPEKGVQPPAPRRSKDEVFDAIAKSAAMEPPAQDSDKPAKRSKESGKAAGAKASESKAKAGEDKSGGDKAKADEETTDSGSSS